MAVPYTIKILTPGGGSVVATLTHAAVNVVGWELNGLGTVSFTMAADDPQAALIETAQHEVQVWRGLDLLWWGVVVRARGDHVTVTYQCLELGWYFTRRVIGQPEQNMIANGSFELGFESWAIGFDPSEPGDNRHTDNWDIEVVSTVPGGAAPIDGGLVLHIWGNDSINAGAVALQSFEWEPDASASPEGDTWSVVGWCYVPSATYVRSRIATWSDDGSTGPLGLQVQRTSTTQFSDIYVPGVGTVSVPHIIEGIMIPIDERTPKDMWVRVEAPLTQPLTGEPEFVSVQCFGPVGDVYWDNISLVRNERLYFNNVDQALIMQGLVEHAQDAVYGKSDLSIATDTPLTTINRTRIYDFYNHELVSDCIDEMPSMWQGVDWSIEITPTTRTFRTHYPRKGSEKPILALTLGVNIASVELSVDGEETSNRVIVMADGDNNAAREEAEAVDAAALNNGLILEKVYNATPGSALNSLKAQAERGVRRYKDPVKMIKVSTFPTATQNLLGVLETGDIVPVIVDLGWFAINENYRVMGMRVDPRTEVLTIDLNPEVNWSLT